jgi:hypothetical protein
MRWWLKLLSIIGTALLNLAEGFLDARRAWRKVRKRRRKGK